MEIVSVEGSVSASTITAVSIVVLLYTLVIVVKGLANSHEQDYIGVLMAGFAQMLPVEYQVGVVVLASYSNNI